MLGIRIPTPGVRRGVGALEVDRIQRRRTPTVASRLQVDRAWQGTGGPTKPRSGMAAGQLGRLAETMSTGTVLIQVHPGPVDTPDDPYPVPRTASRYTLHRTARRTLSTRHTATTALHCIH